MSLTCFGNFLNVATIVVSLIVAFYYWAKYKQTYWARRGVYSPPAHWFFGHFRDALLFRALPQQILADLYRACEDKPVVGFYILQKPFLLIRDNEIIKRVLIKDSHTFPDRYFGNNRTTDTILMSGIFSINSPRWKYLRIKLSPAFSSGKQKQLFNLMVESAENMKEHLESKVLGREERTIEARRVSTKYTTDVISSLSYGVRTNSFDEPEPELYVRGRDAQSDSFQNSVKLFLNFFFPKVNDLIRASLLNRHADFFRNLFWESMNEREKSGVKRGDIIDLLVELKNEKQQNEQFAFEGDHLFAQSNNFFVAGLDTSASTMCFVLMELAKHPELQERVREELRQKIGNEKFTYERTSEISYLQQVINETLRVHPLAPILDRVAVEDYNIPDTDIVIEKGTAVFAILTGLHYDPQHHPDPTTFDPHRFSEERKHLIKPCTYMPFGEGPRNCIAQRTGMLITMVGLITILRQYEVSWDSSYKSEVDKRTLFGAPSDGVHLTFKKSPIITQSDNFFVAGLDTSASTMCFALMELAKHPELQERIREELRQKIGDEKFTYERISEISYLQQVVNETLRMHPLAPILDRVAVEDYKIPGTDVVIEKDTAVYAILTGLHYDPQHHLDPTTFDPDRFSEERKPLIKPCTYMPFGEGPRNCITQRTGMLITMVRLITILREYEVSWDPSYKSEVDKRTLFGAPSDGVHLTFKKSPIST